MSEEAPSHPVPQPNRLSKPFWDAVAQDRLLLQYDPVAKLYQWWPRPVSVYSGTARWEWREASGRGKLASCTRIEAALIAYRGLVPFHLAAIELDEGVRMMARLVNLGSREPSVGMRVRVVFEPLPGGSKMYAFEPA
jgi:uncharacterized OB-fold protein